MARLGVVVSLSSVYAQRRDPKLALARKARNFRSAAYKALGALCLSFGMAAPAMAQAVMPQGITPGSTQIKAGPVNIDMTTGNVVMIIPVRRKTGAFPFSFDLIDNIGNQGAVNQYSAFAGLMSSAGVTSFSNPNPTNCGSNQNPTWKFGDYLPNEWSVSDGTGSRHPYFIFPAIELGPSACGGTIGPVTEVETDGSGITSVVTGSTNASGRLTEVVYNKDGISFTGSTWTDPDGNTISPSGTNGVTTWTDTLGQPAMNFAYGGGNGASNKYYYTDSSGTDQYYTVNYSSYTVTTVFGCVSPYGDIPTNTQMYFPASVTTPVGTYSFTYEPTGSQYPNAVTSRLQKVTLPTGGYVSFAYSGGVAGFNCTSRVVPTIQVTISDNNGNTNTTTYANNNTSNYADPCCANFTVTVTSNADPDNGGVKNVTVNNFSGQWLTQSAAYEGAATGTPLSLVQTNYSGSLATNLIKQTTTYTVYNSTSLAGAKEVITTYDCYSISPCYGNVTSVAKYDYGQILRSTTNITYGGCGTSGYIFDRPCSVTTLDPSNNKVSQTQYTYSATGHPTQTQKWVSGATYLTSSVTYNTNGTIATSTDVNGAQTNYNYDGSCNYQVPTSITLPIVNGVTQTTSQTWDCNGGVVTSSTDANNNKTTYSYLDPLWRQTQVTYPDGGSTTTTYTTGSTTPWSVSTSTAITSSMNRNSTTIYDGLGRVTQTQLTSDPDGTDYVDTTYDVLGRKATVSNPHRTAASSTDGITSYTYDALDRVTSVVQPDSSHVSTSYANNCTTVTDEVGNARKSCVDGLGRLTGVWEDPGTSPHLNFETDYTYDGLDNLLSVTQKGTDVTHPRPRTFIYDGLSRLTQATNPESGTTNYTYSVPGALCAGDPGAVCTKTAPSPNPASTGFSVVTTYAYDALNRLTGKSYVDGYTSNPPTPSVEYGYDGVALTGCTPVPPSNPDSYPKGLRTAMCDGSGATAWKHDQMGRVLTERRTIGSVAGDFENDAYNLSGSPTTITSLGFGVTYTYGGAGRPLTATNYTGGTNKFVTAATYAPPGELTAMTMGSTTGFTGIITNNAYNNRLQPILLSAAVSGQNPVFSECFDFHLGVAVNTSPCSFSAYATGDNGNVFQVVNNRSSSRSEVFTYDSMNRIATAQQTTGTQWGESYTIDAWGNMTAIGSYNGKPHESLSTSANANNQLSGFGYDAAGNMTSNGSSSYVYDAENRLVWTNGTPASRYIYDGDGQRVEKCAATSATAACPTSGSAGTLYWRGLGSDPLSETDLSGTVQNTYIFFNGQRVARRDSAPLIHYYFSDHLGTHGVVENATASACEQDIDYYPYGGVEHDYCPNVAQNYKFTGKERDSESVLDYFGTRHYASPMGRFMRGDEPFADQDTGDPQSWNLYSYALNNPLRYIDPTGMGHTDANGNWVGNEGECELQMGAPVCWNNKTQRWEEAQVMEAGVTPAAARLAWAGLIATTAAVTAYYATHPIQFSNQNSNAAPPANASSSTSTTASPNPNDPTGRKWKLGSKKSERQWRNQMAKRGWTAEQIDEAIAGGQKFPAQNNINPSNGATRYVNPTTGRSVVLDNVTNEVIHVGGDGFRY